MAGISPRLRRWLRHVPPVLGVALLLAALFVVQKEFRHLRIDDIEAAIHRIPRRALWEALACTVASYLVLTLYDVLGTYYVEHRLPYRKIGFASFCAYALSHNIGFSALSGGAVRFRLYAGWGLTPLQVGKLVAFCSLSFALGGLATGGLVLLAEPAQLPFVGDTVPTLLLRAVGLLLWGVVGGYLLLAVRAPEAVIMGHRLRLPRPPLAISQVLVGMTDIATAAFVFYRLLPHEPAHPIGFAAFLALYMTSYSAGIVASLPGGIGVFDTVMLLGLSASMPVPRVVGAILVFRLCYYIIPLFLAGIAFAGHEVMLRARAMLKRAAPPAGGRHQTSGWSEADIAITAGTALVGLCGLLLLAIGVIVPDADVSWLDPQYAPGVIRAGHFVPSLIGAALFVLAIGLSQRVALAWGGTMALLLAGAAVMAAQNRHLWIPGMLVAAGFVLAPYRTAFYRPARLLSGRLQWGTALPLFALVGCVLALAVFERHVRFVSQNSWWNIVFSPLVPNSVRLSVGLAVLVGMFAIWRLIQPGAAQFDTWNFDTRLRYAALGASPPSRADGVVWGRERRAAIPFRRSGRLLVGLGDPAGAERDRVSAIWSLRDLAQREGRAPAVYRVGEMFLDVYGNAGLAALPLGADGLPLPEQPQAGPPARPDAWLMCRAGRDLTDLLPLLPELAGRRRAAA